MLNKLDLSQYVVFTSGNPNYFFELYDKDTLCFVCLLLFPPNTRGKEFKNSCKAETDIEWI